MSNCKFLTVLFMAFFLLSFSACRVRLIDAPAYTEPPQETTQPQPETTTPERIEPTTTSPPPPPPPEQTTTLPPDIITEEIYVPTIEPLALDPIQNPTQEEYGGYTEGQSTTPTLTENPIPYTPQVTIQTPSDTPGETTLDDDGDGTLGLIIDRYTSVLNSGLGSLFECQRLYIYLERLAPFYTVNRNSPAHALIIESGGHNIAAIREIRVTDTPIVDAEFLQRRNPYVIVRTVGSDVLGRNVTSTARAETVRHEILTRPGIENISAILHRRILLISDELLSSEEGRLIAKLHIAHAMYPTLFSDVDMSEVYRQIAATGGADYTQGIFAF